LFHLATAYSVMLDNLDENPLTEFFTTHLRLGHRIHGATQRGVADSVYIFYFIITYTTNPGVLYHDRSTNQLSDILKVFLPPDDENTNFNHLMENFDNHTSVPFCFYVF
jgi:hypothetical protein